MSNLVTAGVKRLSFTQLTPSKIWEVYHNFGCLTPIIDVYLIDNGQKVVVLPENIEYVSTNQVNIHWSVDEIGGGIIVAG